MVAEKLQSTPDNDASLPVRESAQSGGGKRKLSAPSGIMSPKQVFKKFKSTRASVPNTSVLTTAFLKYLENGNPTNEVKLLNDIGRELALNPPRFPDLQGAASSSVTFPTIMVAWLTYRRAILSVRQRASTPAEPPMAGIHLKVYRSRLLTELRKARDAFMAASGDSTLASEDVICMAFERLQGSDEETQQVRDAIRSGFKSLDEKLLELGDELGGGKWIFGA